MKLNKAIFRVFEVRAKPGKAQLLKQKLSDTSVSVVKDKPGNLGHLFGKNLSSDENDLVFISVWKDLESIKSLFGEDWEESFLPEGYEEIIESCSIKHIKFDGSLASPEYKDKQNSHTYNAIKERGTVYYLMFQELKKRYGEEEAVSIMKSISRAQGQVTGKSMAHLGPRDFQGLCKSWVLSPDDGATFKPDIRRLDENGIEVKMMACPIKDAWVEAGCTDDEICTLLHCASAYDQTALETAGFDYEIELWSPGKEGCCLTKIFEKK